MELEIKLIENPAQIADKIDKALKEKTSQAMQIAVSRVREGIQQLFIQVIHHNATFRAIIDNDKLRGALGVPDPEPRLDYLVNYLAENIDVKLTEDGLSIVLLRPGYLSIDDEEMFIIREHTVSPLPWLKWLLEKGTDLIIKDYQVVYGSYGIEYSRTGIAIMDRVQGSFWSVPLEYAGTAENNFITESFQDMDRSNLFSETIEKQVKAAFHELRS